MECELTYLCQPLTFQVISNKKLPFPGVMFFVNSFFTILDRVFILSPSCFSRQGGSIHMPYDPERSLINFDLRAPKVKVTYLRK